LKSKRWEQGRKENFNLSDIIYSLPDWAEEKKGVLLPNNQQERANYAGLKDGIETQ